MKKILAVIVGLGLFSACSQPAEIRISSVADTMAFDVGSVTVKAGQAVNLTLKNNATSPVLPHNWVLVKPGTEAAVAERGLGAGESAGYIQAHDADVLASTALARPGTSVELKFTAPAAGTYPFICTVPGHYMMMKGVLIVM